MRGRRKLLCLLLAGMTLLLTACGNLFDREYLSVTDYEIPVQEPAREAEAGVAAGSAKTPSGIAKPSASSLK